MIYINDNNESLFLYNPMIALVVVSSVQFVLEAHQRTQIRMNVIVSVVVGLCLFSEVFSDTTERKCTDIQYSNCTCGPVDVSTVYQCTSDQNEDQYLMSIDEIKEVCSTCTDCINRTMDYWWWLQYPSANNLPLYIFLDSLPVLILVPLILFFNIDLASGPGHSLVFMYQALVALFHIPPYNQDYQGCTNINLDILSVSGLLVLFNAPLQLFWHPQTLTHYSLGYVKVLIAGVLVAVSFFLATCTQCPFQCCRGPWAKLRRVVRNWRERHFPQRPVLTGVCSVAILMYGSLVEVSFRLLFRCELPDNICHCPRYSYFTDSTHNATFCCMHEHTASSQSLCWGPPQHLPYFIPAWIFVGVAVLLSLPFFYHPGVPALASYLTRGRVQLPRLHKLAPLLNLFQGVYKPKMQFFTGLHLLYRIALWSAAAFAYSSYKMFSFSLLSIVILAVHSLFQPFENRRHTYVETLLMVNVVFIAVLYSFSYSNSVQLLNLRSVLTIFAVLANLPLFCVIVYYPYKLIRHCCCSRRREYHEIQAQDEVEEDGDSFQGERWEPPQDEAFH